jgi:hypothetical protein
VILTILAGYSEGCDDLTARLPAVLGHEGADIVERVGKGAERHSLVDCGSHGVPDSAPAVARGLAQVAFAYFSLEGLPINYQRLRLRRGKGSLNAVRGD